MSESRAAAASSTAATVWKQRYEALRQLALGGRQILESDPLGLVLLLREGVAGWMRGWSEPAPTPPLPSASMPAGRFDQRLATATHASVSRNELGPSAQPGRIMSAESKVTAEHLKRAAYLYIRQSTLRQVLENTESTKRQYALRQRAIVLGWPEERIIVIDHDQAQSAASAVDREGFQRLVSEVGLGKAGIVSVASASVRSLKNLGWLSCGSDPV